MRLIPELLLWALLTGSVASGAPAGPAASGVIHKNGVAFDRFELDDNAKVEWIRKSGNLAGKGAGSAADQPLVTGWVEYDFTVARAGWHGLSVDPTGAGHEFLIDGRDRYYGSGPKVANLWLAPGPHTLRIQRGIWTGFGPITGWQLTPAGAEPAARIAVRTTDPWKVIRMGESLAVTVSYGDLAAPVKLSLLVRERSKPAVVDTVAVNLAAGGGLRSARLEIPGRRQGVFELGYQVDDLAAQATVLPPVVFAVVDTTPVAPAEGAITKRLVAEIDAARQAPDFFQGGATRVVNKSFGSYRESGDVGYLQHQNATDPSWFAYKYQVPDPGALYWMEFDYPDDARRSFLVVPRSGNALIPGQHSYAGPGTGPDTGREFSLTNKLQTMGIYFWPHGTDLRALVLQPQSGLRAAVSKIRIYQVEGAFTPLPHAGNGREFIHWYEEGTSFMGFFGAANATPESVILAADNWARIMASMGTSLLMPTLSIYQMGMYPSTYNPQFSDSNSFDAARVIELLCEKYGLRFSAEFHPEGRGLKLPTALAKSPDSIYQFNRFGKAWDGGDGPKFNFLHPAVEQFAVGLVGEFADRYGSSPAFDGVSIRLMGWQNTGFGNFDNLDWGYGDFTIRRFERDTRSKIPVAGDDPARFEKRYQWIMANAKESWMHWRCQKATEFFGKVSARLRQKHPQARLFVNDFLAPSHNNSQAWYDNFLTAPRDAGIDPARLAAVPGVELLNAILPYGRRSAEDMDQRQRDALLNPGFLGALKQPGKAMGFLTSQAYFEATTAVAPPQDLGYPAKTAHGWMSGCVNPAGRHYLERFALALAEYDAATLGDGGNGYTIGQPLLREFLREFRALPKQNFHARPDARDPVAVWERPGGQELLFYAVNRERYPVQLAIQFEQPPVITRLAGGAAVPTADTTLQFDLQPYELRAFRAGPGARIRQVRQTIPGSDLKRVGQMTQWLRRLADEAAAGTAGADLSPAQKSLLGGAATEAETCLRDGRYWRARTLQEDQRLREIYRKCGRLPSLLDQNGPVSVPAGALSGAALFEKVTSKQGGMLDSAQVAPEWTGQQLVVSAGGDLALAIEAPVDGKYQFRFGQVVGDGFADSAVHVDGAEIGVLKSRAEPVHGILAMLPATVSLTKGQHQLVMRPAGGQRQGLLFLELLPDYQDIVLNRWMLAGPFVATAATGRAAGPAIEDAMRNRVFAPESARELVAAPAAPNNQWKWQRQAGLDDFVDFKKLTGQGQGSIHYAVTHVFSPVAREVAVAYASDYYTRMWLNGAVVQELYHPDGQPQKGQLKFRLPLQQGVNELLLKVGAGSGGNGFWLAVNNPGDLKFTPLASTRNTAAPAPGDNARSGKELLRDDFQSGNLGQWQPVPAGAAPKSPGWTAVADPDVADARQQVLSTPEMATQTYIYHIAPGAFAGTALQLGFRFNEDQTDHQWNTTWTLFSDAILNGAFLVNGYSVFLGFTGNANDRKASVSISRVDASNGTGSRAVLASASLPREAFQPGWNEVRFRWLADGSLTVVLNGVAVVTANDTKYPVAFRTLANATWISNNLPRLASLPDGRKLFFDDVCVEGVAP